jgi:replicative DNA helicase
LGGEEIMANIKSVPLRLPRAETGGKRKLLERVPPQNLEAERSVLGSMLLEKEAIGKVIDILTKEDFYNDGHKEIFSATINLFENNKAVDLVTIAEQLRREGSLEEIGGAVYLTSLLNSVPTAANVEYYAEIIKEKAVLRNLINAATQIVTSGYEDKEETGILLDRAQQLIFDISQKRARRDFIPLKDAVKDGMETIERLQKFGKGHITGIPTGFKELDLRTSGLQSSDLIVIASRPSMGKTSICLNIAQYVGIEEKIPLAIFSLETSREQLAQRMLCAEARIDAHKLRTGFLPESAWPKLGIASGRLADAPIFIDDTPGISSLEIRAKSRRLKAEHNIGLIIIDYLQLMRGGGKAENRQQEISEISRALKSLARELEVPLIAVSQLSREVEKRPGNRPQLSDLRESGAIEQDADLCIFIFREELYKRTKENKGVAEIIIGKQRNGPVGTVKLAWIEEYTRFGNLARRKE